MTKNKKIAIIAVGAVVIALVITTIILAVVQSTFYAPDIKNADEVRVLINGSEVGAGVYTNPNTYDTENEDAEEKVFLDIMEKINLSEKESVLTSLFGGAYKYNEALAETDTELSAIKENEVVIEFKFDKEQTLKMNGEVKKDSDGNEIKYNKVYIVVNDTTDLTETTAYLCVANKDKSSFKLTYLSKQAELYSFVKTLAE